MNDLIVDKKKEKKSNKIKVSSKSIYTNTFDQSHIFSFFCFFLFTAKHVLTFKIHYILHLRTQYSRY